MNVETLALIIRAVVLIGAVLFSFTLMISGFYLVFREYRLVRTFNHLKEFIALTKDATLEADLAKRTLSLSRTRPGLVMIGIGSVLLLACIWNPLKLETSTSLSSEAKSSSPSPFPSSLSFVPANSPPTSYDRWLDNVAVLNAISPEEQGKVLSAVSPDAGIGQQTFLALDGDTIDSIAEGVYGAPKYSPLVRAFNPNLQKEGTVVRGGTPIQVLVDRELSNRPGIFGTQKNPNFNR